MTNQNQGPLCTPLPAGIISGFISLFLISLAWLAGWTYNQPGSLLGALFWSGICGGMTYLMLSQGRLNPWRYWFFLALAIGMLIAIQGSSNPSILEWPRSQAPSTKLQTPFCHISLVSIIGNLITNELAAVFSAHWKTYGHYYLLGLVYLLVTLLLGTGWCAWACGYGAWDETFSRCAPRRPLLKFPLQPGRERHLGVGVLLAFVLLAWMSREAVFCQWICPFKLTYNFWDPQGLSRFLQIGLMTVALVGGVVLLPLLTGKRFFCSYLCPFGAWQSLVGRRTPFQVQASVDKCTHCGQCQSSCPMQAIRMSPEKAPQVSAYCTRCGICVDQCPSQSMQIVWMPGSRRTALITPLISRIFFILTSVTVAGMVGIGVWGIAGRNLWQLFKL